MRLKVSDLTAKPQAAEEPVNHHRTEDHEPNERNNFDEIEEEEDPYNICREDIYDTVDIVSTYTPAVVNRPPAPIPRPQAEREPERPERPATYISKGLCFKIFFFQYFKAVCCS